jgi:hypothetical protein
LNRPTIPYYQSNSETMSVLLVFSRPRDAIMLLFMHIPRLGDRCLPIAQAHIKVAIRLPLHVIIVNFRVKLKYIRFTLWPRKD